MTLPAPRLHAALVLSCASLLLCSCSSSSANASGPADAAEELRATDEASTTTDAGPAPQQPDADAPDVFASCPATRPTGTIPSDVAAVLSAKCQPCHQSPTKNHAPFPLLTYADTQKADPLPPYTGLPIWQVMHTVIQPGGVPHMPFGNAPQLTAAEMQTLDGWLLGCALPVTGDDAALEASSEAAADGSGE
jgi:hypothetical protein